MSNRERLVVALDLPGKEETLSLARQLKDDVGMVKVGLEGFVAHGPNLVRSLHGLGLSVFLDLKVHDIPRTAAAALTQASALGVRLVTVHALGGAAMVRAAREAATGHTEVIAVTLLTSMDRAAVGEVGLDGTMQAVSCRLGEMALSSGAHGLVCSGLELPALRSLGGSRVVPGIRPAGAETGDQKRVVTPATAVAQGATWIVVGRPIVKAADPRAAAQSILIQMARGPSPR